MNSGGRRVSEGPGLADGFDWHEAGLTVGQVARRSGVAASAVRFYERQGLLSSDRTGGNQRRYRGDVLCRIAMIRACQQVGLSLAEIRVALADLPDGHIPTGADWERLARGLRGRLRDHLAHMNRLLDAYTADADDDTGGDGIDR
jgi:MerR family redox-sensitive transcriptional activator SoxR